MPLARVVAVAPGSPADTAGVLVGDELVDVNGEELRDVIRYQVQVDEPEVELTLRRGEALIPVTVDEARRRAARRGARTARSSTGCAPATTTARSASSTSCPRACGAACT